jgi:signal transduction histidine kinase
MSELFGTKFAPAEKAAPEVLAEDVRLLLQSAMLYHLVDAIPCIVLILNKERQAVFENKGLRESLGISADASILGMRPGEILGCVHVTESSSGCGTHEACRACGVVKTILDAQSKKNTIVNECRIRAPNGGSYDFLIRASQYRFEGREFTIASLLDISDKKRRLALERTFLHDINNILFLILGHSDLLGSSDLPQTLRDSVNAIKEASRELDAEISSHKQLLQAENGELSAQLSDYINSKEFAESLVHMACNVWKDRRILLGQRVEKMSIQTNRSLLHRVMYNMIKNAVEAAVPDEVVTINCFQDGGAGVFSVHNPTVIPPDSQLQIFQRSFSTKGNGRGIGTYSMKLFGERYLKGKVWFSSSEREGTTFFIALPLSE